MLTDYIQIFCGSGIDALELKNRLNDISIYPIIKDESKSGNLAGFEFPMFTTLNGATFDLLSSAPAIPTKRSTALGMASINKRIPCTRSSM